MLIIHHFEKAVRLIYIQQNDEFFKVVGSVIVYLTKLYNYSKQSQIQFASFSCAQAPPWKLYRYEYRVQFAIN